MVVWLAGWLAGWLVGLLAAFQHHQPDSDLGCLFALIWWQFRVARAW